MFVDKIVSIPRFFFAAFKLAKLNAFLFIPFLKGFNFVFVSFFYEVKNVSQTCVGTDTNGDWIKTVIILLSFVSKRFLFF